MAWHSGQEDAQPLGRDVQDVRRAITFRRSSVTLMKELPKRNLQMQRERAAYETKQDNDTSDRKFDTVRTKTFNFHGLITKLRTKTSQKTQKY